MPLQIPTRKNLVAAGQAYFRSYVPEWDTSTQRRSYVGGLLKACTSALHDWYVALKLWTDVQAWPQTATGAFFSQGWWIDITGLTRKPAAAAQGRIVVTGDVGTLVPAGTVWVSGSTLYTTDADVTIATQQIVGTSTVVDKTRARFETFEPHDLATGMTLVFAGCADTALNGTFVIEVMDSTTIEYDVDGAGVSPLEPSPLLTGTWASTVATCEDVGPSGNLSSGATLSLNSAVTGLDDSAYVTFDGVADGADVETLESWRERVLAALGTDYGTFSADEIIEVARTVPGVTRVFVRKPTREVTDGYPLEGQVRVSFLREHDSDPIPSALEVTQVKAALAQIIPAHMVTDDCEVVAPERYNLHIRFRSISPDTADMRASITANVSQYLTEQATWGGVLSIEGMRCAIRAAVDQRTGRVLASYDLDTPSTDIVLPVDGYPVLASITWRA